MGGDRHANCQIAIDIGNQATAKFVISVNAAGTLFLDAPAQLADPAVRTGIAHAIRPVIGLADAAALLVFNGPGIAARDGGDLARAQLNDIGICIAFLTGEGRHGQP